MKAKIGRSADVANLEVGPDTTGESVTFTQYLRSFIQKANQTLTLEQQAESKLQSEFAAAWNREKAKQEPLRATYRKLVSRQAFLEKTQKSLVTVVRGLQSTRSHLQVQLHQQLEALRSLENMATE